MQDIEHVILDITVLVVVILLIVAKLFTAGGGSTCIVGSVRDADTVVDT